MDARGAHEPCHPLLSPLASLAKLSIGPLVPLLALGADGPHGPVAPRGAGQSPEAADARVPRQPLVPLTDAPGEARPAALAGLGRGGRGSGDNTLEIPPPPHTLYTLLYPTHQINPLTAISTIRLYGQFAQNKTKLSLKANLYLKLSERVFGSLRECVKYFHHRTQLSMATRGKSDNLEHITGACRDKSPRVLALLVRNEAKLSDVSPRHRHISRGSDGGITICRWYFIALPRPGYHHAVLIIYAREH